MYHAIVRHRVRSVFAALSRGDCEPMLDALAPEFSYRFEGDSPIGGIRNRRDTMAQWWARMYRLFPGLSFEVRDVVVSGGPWRTRIFTQLDFHKPLPDGSLYTNVVMQRAVMRWGRIVEIHTLEDTQRCARLLAWQQRGGHAEAGAPPISDHAWPPAGPFMASEGEPSFEGAGKVAAAG